MSAKVDRCCEYGGRLDPSHGRDRKSELLSQIAEFVARSPGLATLGARSQNQSLVIRQRIDGKSIEIAASALDDVLSRVDADAQDFLQINFASGEKILLTHALIGFKPAKREGLSPAKLPKVVTTPDIVSVFEALQEALHASEKRESADELTLLRKVFEAVVAGGESAGFDLSDERSWLSRIPLAPLRASA